MNALLLERTARGDGAAWTEVVERYGPVVQAVAGNSHGLGGTDITGAVQNTWRRLARAVAFGRWAGRRRAVHPRCRCRNTAAHHRRRRPRTRAAPRPDDTSTAAPRPSPAHLEAVRDRVRHAAGDALLETVQALLQAMTDVSTSPAAPTSHRHSGCPSQTPPSHQRRRLQMVRFVHAWNGAPGSV
jgi:DNA-directed RNA polymerase specialized sigma24 family protein